MANELTLAAIKAAAQDAANKALQGNRDEADRSKREAAIKETEARLPEMSRVEFGNYILSRVVEELKPHLTNTIEQFTGLYDERLRALDNLVAEKKVGEAQTDPNFEDFREEVADLISKRPEFSPREALVLAKANNPDKVKELSDKASAVAAEKAEAEKPKFGGMFASGGIATKPDKMDFKDAAAAAWDSAMAGLPDNIFNGGNA